MNLQGKYFLLLFGFGFASGSFAQTFKQLKELHRSKSLSNNELETLSQKSDKTYINRVLDNILIERVVGSENHEKVFTYITNQLKTFDWSVEIDEFINQTPIFGNIKFKNIIATFNPAATRFLVLACHYDSKYFKDEVFVGAIDSAVPCAMMLEIAKTLSGNLKNTKNNQVSLKLIFIDGEEAVHTWGPNDSIYGARNLAKTYEGKQFQLESGDFVNELDKIDVFILLDLIGAANPQFYSFFPNTEHWFKQMYEIETKLHQLSLLKNHNSRYFLNRRSYSRIEDDHLPFLHRGVPILHLITTPFPPEWHTPRDNRDVIDMDSVVNINLILKSFISSYLHLLDVKVREEEKQDRTSEDYVIVSIFLILGVFLIYVQYLKHK